MVLSAKRTINGKLSAAQILLTGLFADKQIQDVMAQYGYTAERLQEGQMLLERTLAAQNNQQIEYSEQYESTRELNRLWEEANQTYIQLSTLARVALKDDPMLLSQLDLLGRRKSALADWLRQVDQFYRNALASDTVFARLARFNVSRERLELGRSQYEQVFEASARQSKERSEAVDATRRRDQLLDELADWLGDFSDIARVALADQPQKLQALGLR
jgi:small-conductance mechanosensitive channel